MINIKDSKSFINSKKNEHWARLFVQRLETLSTTNQKMIEIVLGDIKRKTKKYVISRENLKYIIEYVKHLNATSVVKIVTASKYANLLIYFSDFIGEKSLKEVTKEDIENFFVKFADKSDSYKLAFGRLFKSFFRWLYGYKKDDGYPEVVSWISCRKNRNRKLPEILTMEEIKKMIEACENFRDRALISILYESGCRASEILDLKIKDLNFDEYGAVLIVNGKTGSRRIRLVSCVQELKAWLNVHPKKNEPQAPLFCALTKNNKGNPLNDSSLNFIVHEIAKKAGINKRVYPHLFRHTRATHLAKFMTEQELKVYFGWARNSDMTSVYIHLSGQDIENKILTINGIKPQEQEELPKIPTFKCYRCGEINSIGNKFCCKCGAPLQHEIIQKMETVKKMIEEVTLYIFDKMKERKIGEEDLESIIEEWKRIKGFSE